MRPNFYARATNLKQNWLKISHFFPKTVKLSSKFWKFWYLIDKIGPIVVPVLENMKIWPIFIQISLVLYYKNESNAFLSIIVIGRFKDNIHQAVSVRIKIGLGPNLSYFSGYLWEL